MRLESQSLIGAFVAMALLISIVFASNDQALLGISFRDIYDACGSKLYRVSGYLYAFIGISVCYIVGYFASLILPGSNKQSQADS